ncbi:(d)CMP kinase [Aestuariimicrobium soli]|uniref:(d)CMP kinase n=1 Tax=Aestuariimicrobium soli TaxID=2035834 RepID=UPI003EBB918D
MPPLVVAIDGPSGSGKSSTAKGVAQRLGLAYLDTGSMYRAVAVAHLESGLSSDDADGIAALVDAHDYQVGTDPTGPTIAIDGRDVTEAIRDPQVSAHVSVVATNLGVRAALTERMRALVVQHAERMVVEGRDITTKVCPDAHVRVLLVADADARIRRREAELAGRADTEAVTDQIVRRDRDDSTVSQFEQPAEGVTLIDSTHLTLAEVIDRIVALVPEPDPHPTT